MNKYKREPDFVIDLHWHTTKEAELVLDTLIAAGGYKHIRIITGKGTFRETGPVMRNFVKDYLENRDLTFETSKLYEGGEGALEVFLE